MYSILILAGVAGATAWWFYRLGAPTPANQQPSTANPEPTPEPTPEPAPTPAPQQPPTAARPSASIRNKNPGAMYPGPSARKFGSTSYEKLSNGHKIATFEHWDDGCAALFLLWYNSYTGRTITAAMDKWSGGNDSREYASYIEKATGVSSTSKQMFNSEAFAIKLGKAIALWEAGRPPPIGDADWQSGYAKFSGAI